MDTPINSRDKKQLTIVEENEHCDTVYNYVEMSKYETILHNKTPVTLTPRQGPISLFMSNNHEVSELKNRISQLEHLVISSSTLNVTNNFNMNNNSSLPSSQQLLSTQGLYYRINQLETLLASSELDNQNLNHEINVSNAKIQELEVNLKEQLYDKDIEISDLQQNIKLLSIKLAKSNKKIVVMEQYINTLPSQDELDDAKKEVFHLETQNQYQGQVLDRTQAQLTHLEQEFIKLETEYSVSKRRLEELEPLKEAMNQMLNAPTSDKPDITKLMELVTVQKAQLLRSKKIIESHRNELTLMETEKGELILEISEKSSKIQSLDDANKFLQVHLENSKTRIEELETDRNKAQKELQELRNKLDECDRIFRLRQQEMINILRLINELGVVIHDMELLLKCGQELCSGEEPSVDLMLGLDFEFNDPDEDCSEGISSHLDIDSEWILSKYNTVRDFRKIIKEFRSQLTNVYTDNITTKLVKGCGIQ